MSDEQVVDAASLASSADSPFTYPDLEAILTALENP